MTCVEMVTDQNGDGDSCNLPASDPIHDYHEIDAVSAYPPELRNSPLVHIQCVSECVTGDPECPGIRLTQLMKPR